MTKGDKEKYRVEAAIAAMQAMIPICIADGIDSSGCANDARMFADALMKELGLDGE